MHKPTKRTRLLAAALCTLVLHGSLASGADLYAEDFDAGEGGYFRSGSAPSWEYGEPASGPGAAQSGTRCWATALDGDYNANEDSYLYSPGIDLSAHSGSLLVLSWWQSLHTETRFDHASLEVTTDGAANWQRVYGEATGQVSTSWSRKFVVLDPQAAVSNFRFRFRLRSDASGSAPGFYIDTIRIISLTQQQVYFENFEQGSGDYQPTGVNSSWELGTPAAGPAGAFSGGHVWATNLLTFYSSNEASSLLSPALDLSAYPGRAFLLSWWQVLATESQFDFASVDARSGPTEPWVRIYGDVSGLVSESWTRQSVLLGPEFATSATQLRFNLRADSFFESSGFYLDDIALHVVEGTTPATVSWPSPAAITTRVPLDSSQLNATAPVPGSFSYSPGAGALLPAGPAQALQVTFTPNDLLTYSPVIASTTIEVLQGSGSYAAWSPFPPGSDPALTHPDADFDFDGWDNRAEYGFVTDPTSPYSTGAPRLILMRLNDTNHVALEFFVRDDDPALSYRVESSSTLVDWTTLALSFDGASWSLEDGELLLASAQKISSGIWKLRVRSRSPVGSLRSNFLQIGVSM